MSKIIDRVGLVLGSLLMTLGCSTAPTPATNSHAVRQHADTAFQQLKGQEHSQQQGVPQSSSQASTPDSATVMPALSIRQGVQISSAEDGPSDGEYVRATGCGNLAKELYLCQHSADLAARVELSKLAHVKVTERSTERIRAIPLCRIAIPADSDGSVYNVVLKGSPSAYIGRRSYGLWLWWA